MRHVERSEPVLAFFDLVIHTPQLTLRYPDDDRAAELMHLAATVGIHDPAYMPFAIPWTRFDPSYLQQQGMQHYWRTRADLTPESWDLPFAVYDGDKLVGLQALGSKSFLVTRSVGTGSWLISTAQGRGVGKEMRAAVLHLAFNELGAERAVTSAWADNAQSLGVTRALGYAHNGHDFEDREGKPVEHLRFILERSSWEARRRGDIDVENLEPCLVALGLAKPPG